ncbi:hypothetical protein [Haliangium sp.]|uniref:hypothetical protein n=1 Tax=Haliangium sp. TaxID=2663208 RepID=UPI003D135A3A
MVDERLTLTIHLERSGDTLRVSYYDDKLRRLDDGPAEQAWSDIGTDFDYTPAGGTHLRGLDAITAVLDAGKAPELVHYFTQGDLVDVGHIFFTTLLGSSSRWEPVLRRLFDEHGEVRPNPPRRSVRVRIWTNVDALIDLPWRLTAWKGKFLVESGWTFEVVAVAEAGPDIRFETPCPILVVAPSYAGMEDINTAEHVEALRQALPGQYLTPSGFREVRSRAAMREAFLGMHPKVLYYYGHAEIRGEQVCLLLGDEGEPVEAINALDLKQIMSPHPPQLVYINACKSGASGWHSMGYQLAPEVPVVVANPTTSWSTHAGRVAVQWLIDCLEHGRDPVIAAHTTDEESSTRGFEWGMRTIHANYDTWRAEPLVALGPLTPIGLRLNRDVSRERVQGLVTRLVRDEDRRVAAIVSYAARGNRIDMSYEQLKDQLEDNASHVAQISWRKVSFPRQRDDVHAAMRRDLSISLGASTGEPLDHSLRRCARGLDIPGAMPVLWLSWGPFGRHLNQSLGFEELRMWVELGSELAQICPPDIRVVAFLSIETDEAPHPRLEEEVHLLGIEHVLDAAFSCDLIPPLPDVTLLDIAKFLSDKNNSRCPPSLLQEMARRIYRRTSGSYEDTVRIIERAEEDGWYTILKELRADEPERPRDSMII